MSETLTGMKVLSDEEKFRQRGVELWDRATSAEAELRMLKSEADADQKRSFYEAKASRQSKALHALNRRVRIQRLVLRELYAMDPEQADTLYRLTLDKHAAELGEDQGLSL
jgi:hypothetical protein